MKAIVLSVVFALVLIGMAVFFSSRSTNDNADNKANVSVVDGKQIIEIGARGGYSPGQTIAKSGIPTVIRVSTNGTFDCSAALMIPAIGYRQNLPPTGTTEIEVPSQEPGAVLRGLCTMGMYNFQIKFD